ncbi:NADP oxidoreductase [Desulforhabdus amnigena]|uniref:Oxidoreductase n=1 Tax=Desulforhabdus amnigena TaxID=40218 RepID=A0A9W6FW59_9BACT|nr:NADP oxidoreductase [Desulforhabdus amnigena]NLJ28214.1 NADP oxidoreductase [Deltaproteobacteria bacterium]GLI35927.1 oxidoreductase [Desulforhabdus amnigena]
MTEFKNEKVSLATVWLSGCSGCHMSFLDLDEHLLELEKHVRLVFSPLADHKRFPEGVDVVLVEGAVGNVEQLALARTLRERSRVVVALGDCAVTGNVPALRNRLDSEAMVRTVYAGGMDFPGLDPAGLDEKEWVPRLLPSALPLHRVVPVDVFLPGCPPGPQSILAAVTALVRGEPLVLPEAMRRFG